MRRTLLQYNNAADCTRGYFIAIYAGPAAGYCLSQNDAAGSDLTIGPCANSSSQLWAWDGATLKNFASGLCLGAACYAT